MTQSAQTALKEISYFPVTHSFEAPKDDGRLAPNGSEIKRLRKQRCLTQEDLSCHTGISLKTIRNLESNGKYRCTSDTLHTLASFFKVEANILAKAEDALRTKLLFSTQDIIAANTEIAASAKKILACVGSRARDPYYLDQIETALKNNPALIHYRAMALPPFTQIFQDHLLRLLKIRDPYCRALGTKTLHVGIYEDTLKQCEFSFCANEKTVLIVLPSMHGFAEYNTALLVQSAAMAQKYIMQAKILYQMGNPVETEEDIRRLGLIQKGEQYV